MNPKEIEKFWWSFPFQVHKIIWCLMMGFDWCENETECSSYYFEALRRYEAAGWLRKTVGVVGGKDLPAEPSEEEFRLGLRSGIILCNVLNKVQPGAVAKVLSSSIFPL